MGYPTDHVRPSGPPDRIPAYNDSGQRLYINNKPAYTDQLGPNSNATTRNGTRGHKDKYDQNTEANK